MMKKRLSSREWEALSAYIDGQLTEKERARLEARLKAAPELREALEEMKGIRALLRSLPKVRAPRNFTLTSQMVSTHQPRPSTYPVLRLAFALSTILLAITFLGELFIPRGLPLSAQMVEQSEPPPIAMLEAAPEVYDEHPAEAPAAPLEEGEQPIEPEGESMEALALEEVDRTPPAEKAVPPEPHATLPPQPETTKDERSTTPVEEMYPIEEPNERVGDITEPVSLFSAGWTAMRYLQATLALIALSTGFAVLYLRRKAGP